MTFAMSSPQLILPVLVLLTLSLFSGRLLLINTITTDSPLTALNEFLTTNSDFVIDKEIDNKLLISVARNGYLLKG